MKNIFQWQYVLAFIVFLPACWDLQLSSRDTDSPNNENEGSDNGQSSDSPDPTDTEIDEVLTSPCAKIPCNAPDRNTCGPQSDSVIRHSRNGYCIADNGIAHCEYPTFTDTCLSGVCVDGTCPSVAAQNFYCFEAPANECSGNNLIAYYPHGVATVDASAPTCIYSQETITCAQGCENGKCKGDPCLGVTCNDPPPRYCYKDILVKWESLGRCDETGKCAYNKQTITCKNGCSDGACNDEDICQYTFCTMPPGNFCLNDTTLYAYTEHGFCEEGACIYQGEEITCNCLNGKCANDPCLGVACIYPPPPRCTDDGKLRFWDGGVWGNLCIDGNCVYDFNEPDEECDQGDCMEGRCPDFCEARNFYCDSLPPPPSYCDGDTAISFTSEGVCNGTGFCEYPIVSDNCPTGCEAGGCL